MHWPTNSASVNPVEAVEEAGPILLNLQTRIDMSQEFDRGAENLVAELANEGL